MSQKDLIAYWTRELGDDAQGRAFGLMHADILGRFERLVDRAKSHQLRMNQVFRDWQSVMDKLDTLQFRPAFQSLLAEALCNELASGRPHNALEFYLSFKNRLVSSGTQRLTDLIAAMFEDVRYLTLAYEHHTHPLRPLLNNWVIQIQEMSPCSPLKNAAEYVGIIRQRQEFIPVGKAFFGDWFGRALSTELEKEIDKLPREGLEWARARERVQQLCKSLQ